MLSQFKACLGNGSPDKTPQERYAREWSNRTKLLFQTVWNTDVDKPVVDILALVQKNVALRRWEGDHLPSSLSFRYQVLGPFGPITEEKPAAVPGGPVRDQLMKCGDGA